MRLEAALSVAAGGRSGRVGEADFSGLGEGVVEEEEEEKEHKNGRESPVFELRVFREVWRCFMLCWDPQVRWTISAMTPCVGHDTVNGCQTLYVMLDTAVGQRRPWLNL